MTPDSLRIDISDMVSSAPGGAGDTKPSGPDQKTKRGILSRTLRWIALLIFLAVLPFFTLVRVSVFLLPQEDGYAYAVDIRTLGRPEWRTRLVSLYFRAMGFGTLRHVGTADHLHVYLEPRGEH
jgi:hypothetical protein